MTAIDVLHELRQRGITLMAHGDKLRFHPRAKVHGGMVTVLLKHKAELLVLLATEAGDGDGTPVISRDIEVVEPVAKPWRCRCGSTAWVDVVLRHDPHNGTSTRRDCLRCNRFVSFPLWYGRPSEN